MIDADGNSSINNSLTFKLLSYLSTYKNLRY